MDISNISQTDLMEFQEFKNLYAEDSALVVDSRSKASYEEGHIPGAILMPLNTVKINFSELSHVTKPIVVYCSWPNEETSARAALIMIENGIKNVYALRGGYRKRVSDGNPVEK